MQRVRILLERIDYKYLVLAIWVTMTMTYIIYIGISSRFITYGEQLDRLEKRQKQLIMENMILENEIASASALRHISVKARELGFGEPKIMYIK